jgi:hypothetical protein
MSIAYRLVWVSIVGIWVSVVMRVSALGFWVCAHISPSLFHSVLICAEKNHLCQLTMHSTDDLLIVVVFVH